MNEKMPSEQALESIKSAWDASEGLSWELAGQVLLIAVVAALTIYVAKYAKNFKDKL